VICPACQTNNAHHPEATACTQCGSDLYVHHLLQKIREEVQMQANVTVSSPNTVSAMHVAAAPSAVTEEVSSMKTTTPSSSQTSRIDMIFQLLPTLFFLTCAVFGMFVGMRLLTFIEQETSQRTTLSNKWSEVGFEQLQQMNTTIKQELDLILDLRHENQMLIAKINELNVITKNNTITKAAATPQGRNP